MRSKINQFTSELFSFNNDVIFNFLMFIKSLYIN